MKIFKSVLILFLCLIITFSICGCSQLNPRYKNYGTEVLYCADGYVPKYAYQLIRYESYTVIDLFGIEIGPTESSYTYLRTNGSLTDIEFKSEDDLLKEEEKQFRQLLSKEHCGQIKDMDTFRILKFVNETYALYSNAQNNNLETYSFRLYKYDKNRNISFVDFELTKKSLTDQNYDTDITLSLDNKMLNVCDCILFDFDLNQIVGVEPSPELNLDENVVAEWMHRLHNEKVDEVADKLVDVVTVYCIEDMYYCLLHYSNMTSFILEVDVNGNVKMLTALNMKTNQIKLLQEIETDGEHSYYDVNFSS